MGIQANNGAISQRTNTYAVVDILSDAKPRLMLEKWADHKDLPKNRGNHMTHRRYHDLPDNMHPIEVDINPTAARMRWTDITATLRMFGTDVELGKIERDFHEDPVLRLATKLTGESIARIREKLGYNIVIGGSKLIRVNGSARSDINTLVSLDDFEIALEVLEGNNAEAIEELVDSSPDYGTESIQPSYIAYHHTNQSSTIRKLDGFVHVQDYHNQMAMSGEIGTIAERIRCVASTIAEPWANAGSSNLNGMRGVTGVNVYPIVIFAKHAWSVSKLAGEQAVKLHVGTPVSSTVDHHALSGYVASDFYYSGVILNNNFLVRIEAAAPSRS